MNRWKRIGAAALVIGIVAVSVAARIVRESGAACCYFAAKDKDINQPGQKAFVQWSPDEAIEAFTVQPKFEGNALDFGMVIPTPAQPKLDEMPRDFFKDLAIYTILLPLPQPIWTDLVPRPVKEGAGRQAGSAAGGAVNALEKGKDHGVVVLEAGVVGSLDYKIITASDANGLFSWLKENNYSYGGDEGTLDFYIKKAWFFTVMKIDSKQMKRNADGSYLGEVTPTRFTFTSKECVYPLKITQISVKNKTDALFYVQAPAQMDLKGDWSWQHSYRVMYLTYMLGCGANPEQQQELQTRNQWVAAKKQADPNFETTKLEWAKKLGDAELAVVEDPLANYAQAGGSALPAGATFVSQPEFLKQVWEAYEKDPGRGKDDSYAKERLKQLATSYPADKGAIARIANPGGSYYYTPYAWFPNREVPAEDVKGLTRLKGHLQKGKWVTKFRKEIRKDEMADDLILVPVDAGKEQEYVRVMPTSPP